MHVFDLLYFVNIGLYCFGAVLYFLGALTSSRALKRSASWLAVIGFALHTAMLVHFLASGPLSQLTQGWYLKLMSWCMLLIFFILWWRLKHEFLALMASPLALFVFISSLAMPQAGAVMPKSLSAVLLIVHVGSLFVSVGLSAVACVAGLVFLHQNRTIKSKAKLSTFDKDLPALSVFDRVNHWAVVIGFPLYTLGVISGFIGAKFTLEKVIAWLAILIWLLFALLFHLRLAFGWRGRKPATLAIWIFLLFLATLLINFVLPTEQTFHP
ncbi:MAG: cytochrome C assembly protein [Desulfovibrio sp.]|nr:MAG: cytochrome C assembly protein [Desulfovibrio sp.]